MENVTMDPVTGALLMALIVILALTFLTWAVEGLQSSIYARKKDKRDEERDQREAEYHIARMKALKK